MSAPDVCLIAPYPSIGQAHHNGSSGVASYSANLARALRDDGADVHVVAPVDDTDHRERDEEPERPHHTASKWPIQPSSANSLWWAWNM